MQTGGEILKRRRAGMYGTEDGRFAVEKASGGWMVVDAEQADDLGLPLVRGPFGSLDDAREAIAAARSGPVPASNLPERSAALSRGLRRGPARTARARAAAARAAEPRPVVIRAFRSSDGDALRALWTAVDFRSLGDDDAGLDTLARRNPGLLLVAERGGTVVGSALGAWDGRRGWIYHVATAADHRRQRIARDLVRRIETRLRDLGAPKINVLVQESNEVGARFWEALGYGPAPARQFGRELAEQGSLDRPGRG